MDGRTITIGIPTGEYFTVCRDFHMRLTQMICYSYEQKVCERINLVYTASPITAGNRNMILKKKQGSHIFMVDADMTFPADTLENLLKTADENPNCIITGLGFMGAPPFYPAIYRWLPESLMAQPIGAWPDAPFEIDACGSFGMLIPSNVAEIMGDECFNHIFAPEPKDPSKSREIRHDLAFCTRARTQGFKIICDPRIQFGHIRPYPITLADWEVSRGSLPPTP